MTNADIAAAFERIALLLSLRGTDNPFRIRAYRRAAEVVAHAPQDLRSLYESGGRAALEDLAGIGKDLAQKIEEMLRTGRMAFLAEVEADVPPGLLAMLTVEGMGPKRAKQVYDRFGVTSLAQLQAIAESGQLAALPGWGDASVQNLLRGIAQQATMAGRIPLHRAASLVEDILARLQATGLCDALEVAGSYRRRRATVGDLDFLATSRDPSALMDAFCTLPTVADIKAKGPTKSTVYLSAGIDADLRVVDRDVFGAALLYFTGSKEHNVRIRRRCIERGFTLSEYGLYRGTAEKKGDRVAARHEEDVYRAVDLPWIPPELREDHGEVDAADAGLLPQLIEIDDVQGDLHLHSDFSDGSVSIAAMASAAKERGLAYIAVTDHASSMGMVGGIDTTEASLRTYLDRVEAARRAVPDMHILAGAEVDIARDGSLYLPDALLRRLDWVVASVHQHFHDSRADATQRLCTAIAHPFVDVLGHPTARLLGKRPGIDVDMEAVLHAARDHDVAMELNAAPERLDLADVHLRRAAQLGVRIAIGSDAHTPEGIDHRFGIDQARRGWLAASDVLNTLSWSAFEQRRRARHRARRSA